MDALQVTRWQMACASMAVIVTCAAAGHAQQPQQQQQQPQPYYPPPPQQGQPQSQTYYQPQPQQPQQPAYYDGPTEMKYRDGQPIPPGYHVESRMRKGLVVAGAVVTGVPWLIGLPTAASGKESADRWLFAPVIGPWGDLMSRPDCEPVDSASGVLSCTGEYFYRFLLVFDGIVQTAGGIMFTIGVAAEKDVLIRNDQARRPVPTHTMKIVPSRLGPNAFGLTAFGQF